MTETKVCHLAFRNFRGHWSPPYVGRRLAGDFASSPAARLLAQHRIVTPFAVPEIVDVSQREKADKKLIFVMNLGDMTQTVRLSRAYRNVLAERDVTGSVVIPPRDSLILSEKWRVPSKGDGGPRS